MGADVAQIAAGGLLLPIRSVCVCGFSWRILCCLLPCSLARWVPVIEFDSK